MKVNYPLLQVTLCIVWNVGKLESQTVIREDTEKTLVGSSGPFSTSQDVGASQASISNVRFYQRSNDWQYVDVYYDLSSIDSNHKFNISLQISKDGGVTWDVPSASATGDIGININTGINKKITWRAGNNEQSQGIIQGDFPNQKSDFMQFKLTAVRTNGLNITTGQAGSFYGSYGFRYVGAYASINSVESVHNFSRSQQLFTPFEQSHTATAASGGFSLSMEAKLNSVIDFRPGLGFTLNHRSSAKASSSGNGNASIQWQRFARECFTIVINEPTNYSYSFNVMRPNVVASFTILHQNQWFVYQESTGSGSGSGIMQPGTYLVEMLSGSTSQRFVATFNGVSQGEGSVEVFLQVGAASLDDLPPASIATSSSPIGTIDTRNDTRLMVTGRVIDSLTHKPLQAAVLQLSGAMTTSATNGEFHLSNVNLEETGILQINAPNYAPQTRTVSVTGSAKSLDVGDILLHPIPEPGDGPVIEWVKLDPDCQFLYGFSTQFKIKARVNWNGTTPHSVVFRANTTPIHTVGGSGPEYEVSFSVDQHFTPSLRADANDITVMATGLATGETLRSHPRRQPVVVMPIPAALVPYIANPANRSTSGLDLKLKFSFPKNKPYGTFNIPILGALGGETSVSGEFNFSLRSGEWSIDLRENFKGSSTKYSAFKLKLGPLEEVTAEIKGSARGTASPSKGIDFSGIEIETVLGLHGKYAIGSYGPLSFLGPGATQTILEVPGLNEAFRAASAIVWLKPSLTGGASIQIHPALQFKGFHLTGKSALEGAYEPRLGPAQARFYLGGEPSLTFGLPGAFFKNMRFKAYAGLEVSFWVIKKNYEYVFVDVTYPSSGPSSLLARSASAFGTNGQLLAAAANATTAWQPMARPWRQADENALFAAAMEQAESGPEATDEPNADSFPLLENMFPFSKPALAGHGDALLLLYVRDTGAANPLQFTEIAFSRFNGTAWSAPAPLAADLRGQFNPKVVFDGDGNAIAVFERVKDMTFEQGGLEDMAALMEIVWSRWDVTTETWSTPQPLTDNGFLDHSAQLAGPMGNGDVLLTWNQNEANQLGGSGAPGEATNNRVMSRRWSSSTQTWSASETLVDSLTGELSESLAAAGDRGVFVWAVDLDGNTEDSGDAELFYRIYDGATQTWGATQRHTTDTVADRNAKAAVDASGNVYLLWKREDDLVMDVNFSGSPALVREDSASLGLEDFSLTLGPSGNVVVIWQEMTEEGSDAYFRVYDPVSNTWGLDGKLTDDASLERSFAPVWDAAGNLTVAYNKVAINKVTKTVEVEGGGVVEVEGVPQPGQVDLMLLKRTLRTDLSLAPEGISADGTDFLTGDEVTLKARVKNSGDLAVENVKVAFYDGDPDDDGELIANAIVPGWLRAADEAEVTLAWVIPDPVKERTIHIVVDPDNEVTEADETNNRLSLPLNGVDLALEYQSGSVLSDGSVRVVVKVRNLSAPASPVSHLKLWPLAGAGAEPLADIPVSLLAPGQSVDVPIQLPPGTQGVGDRDYRLVIDEEESIEDIDRENNEAIFALNLPEVDLNGFSAPEVSILKALLRRYSVGDSVDLDLSFFNLSGNEKLVVSGLPRGLRYDPVSRKITGTVTGLLGESPVEIQVVAGKTVLRATTFNLSVSPNPFQGSYSALLETTEAEPLPAGQLKLLVSTPGSYTATLQLAGQPRRSLKGNFSNDPDSKEQVIDLTFPAIGSLPVTTLQVSLSAAGVSDLVSGNRDGGAQTLRGFRLARAGRTPVLAQRLTLALTDASPGDGVAVPAGTGTLIGTVDGKGLARLAGFTGDAQPFTLAGDLSQTEQMIVWLQPYKNKNSFLGGIATVRGLGLGDRAVSTNAAAEGIKWFKAPDEGEKAYAGGFAARTLEVVGSLWRMPTTAGSLAEIMGLAHQELGVVALNPLSVEGLPSAFRLSERYGLIRIAPNVAAAWKGKVVKSNGTFDGSFALPGGAGGVRGVIFQDASNGGTAGAGLLRVPLAAGPGIPKGAFQTIGFGLSSSVVPVPSDGSSGFSEIEEDALDAIEKRFAVGDVVDIDLSFLVLNGDEKLVIRGLPKGLRFDPTSRRITGTISGLLGELAVEIQVLSGRSVARAIPFNLSVSPYPYQGGYAALLETTDVAPLPAGSLKLLVTSPGSYTATLQLVGETRRSARGSFTSVSEEETQTFNLAFPKQGALPATTLQVTLSRAGDSDLISGQRDGGTQSLRGFRLARPSRSPAAVQKITMALVDAVPGDGVLAPAGVGTLSGTVDPKGTLRLTGFTGDAQALTVAGDLSQTRQAIVWVQPYKSKASYLGGIVSVPELGMGDRVTVSESAAEGLKWFKSADEKEKAYAGGFAARSLEARSSRWLTPSTSGALAESLGVKFGEIEVDAIDPLGVNGIPSRFRLSEKFNLIRIAPNSTALWKGKVTHANGSFSGSLTLPGGAGGVNGILLQDAAHGNTVGAGLLRVLLPVAPGKAKGTFQTIGLELAR